VTLPQPTRERLLRWIRDALAEPRLAGVDLDGAKRIELHRRILLEKRMMLQVTREFYQLCVDLDARYFSGSGDRVELGAGSSLFKHFFPDIISTDVAPAPHLDRVIDAQAMPFPDRSVRAFYAIECFHHLPQPELFFKELERTLVPGGGCVMIEPYYGPIAALLFRRLFDNESFEPDQPGWSTPTAGPMRGANQALSYIVFVRDRREFEGKHPDLRIIIEFPLGSYLRYLVSGGLSFRPLLPGFFSPALRLCELALAPARRLLALHHVIVLRKQPGS
jgi:SAM-dependent methyltransferase